MTKVSYSDKIAAYSLKKSPVILAIETSCDETAASIVVSGREVLSNVIISSAAEHVKYGGVVPEIASRAHTDAVDKAVKSALIDAELDFCDLDAVACTYGAGLLGALLVGVSYAKALAFGLEIPLVPVSHVRGHLAAAYLADKTLDPPFIGLIVSGGHTALAVVSDYDKMQILGGTLDDAAGEAFDKVARVLGLEYPGGPNVEKLAQKGTASVVFPKMLKGTGGYNFSYSGLKTAVINYVRSAVSAGREYSPADVAASFQAAALDVLADKAVEAAREFGLSTIAVGGGVAANGYLRQKLAEKCLSGSIKLVLPNKKECTDNAAMIGAEGFIQYRNRNFAGLDLNACASVMLK